MSGGERRQRDAQERYTWRSSRLPGVTGVVLAAVPVVVAIVQGPLRPWAIAQHAMAAGAAIVALLLTGELALRALCAQLGGRSPASALRRARVGWCGALALLAGVGFAHRPAPWVAVVGGATLAWFRRWRMGVARRARAGRAGSPEDPSRSCPLEAVAHGDGAGERIVIDLHGRIAGGVGVLRRLRTDYAGQLTISAATITVALVAVAALCGAAPPVIRLAQSGFGVGGPPGSPPGTSSTPSAPAAPSPSPPPARGAAESTWDGTCARPPSNAAPVQDEVEIGELYTGNLQTPARGMQTFPLPARAGSAPGRQQGGCTKEFHEQITSVGTFVWAWGQNPNTGEVLSIAVDSDRFGPALFLAPAAALVRGLIARFGAVGGMRRLDAGTGDLYPVQTSIGTFILVRREKSSRLDGYTLVPPVAGQAWAQAMQHTGRFLWPVMVAAGSWEFHADTMTSPVVFRFATDRANGAEPELGERELERDAAKAGR